MNKTLTNTIIIIGPNGQVKIFSTEFNSDVMKQWLERFNKRVSGRAYVDKEGYWMFEPYHVGQSMSSVLFKERIGQISAVRSAKSVKFSLSLPATMTKSQMVLAVLEQCGLLVDALRGGGLYERLTNLPQCTDQNVAEETPKAA
jgi:hypothetical protein